MTEPSVTQPSIRSLTDARYMALDNKPSSEAAIRLCQLLRMALTQADTERKYRRREQKERQFEGAVGAVVADLLLAYAEREDGWAYRSSQAGSFTGGYVTYPNYRDIMLPARSHGLVETIPGFHEKYSFNEDAAGKPVWVSSPNSMTSRFRATNALLELARGFGITAQTVSEHFLQSLPKYPLELRAGSVWWNYEKIKGERMDYEDTPQTRGLEADLHELNRFLDGFVFTGGIHRGYRRIFNQGDKPGFAWNKGGRLFSQGHTSYQQLPSEQRVLMSIAGEAVAEIDIRASFLTILHGLKGWQFDSSRDPYDIKYIPRPVVKKWTTMTIGLHGFHDDWPDEAVAELAEVGIDARKHPMKEVRPLFLHYLPILKDWPKEKLTCFDLMYHESVAIMGTMLALMRGHGTPSLGVHDSLIVPRSAVSLAQQLIKDQYQQICRIEPVLTVKTEGTG